MTLTPPTDDQIRRCAQALAKLYNWSREDLSGVDVSAFPEWAYQGWMGHAHIMLIEAAAVRYAMEEQG